MEDFQTELAPGAGLILKHVSMVLLLYTMYTVYLINQVLGLCWEYNNPRFWQFSLKSVARFGKKKTDLEPTYSQYGPEKAWLIRDL